MTTAILGATSHIAKNLITHFADDSKLFLFARSVPRLQSFLEAALPGHPDIELLDIESFPGFNTRTDLLINCVGFGTPDKVRNSAFDIFQVTEKYDNLSIDYVSRFGTPYISFSSGAVYGPEIAGFIDENAEFRIRMSAIQPGDAYRISKLNSEAKHRALEDLPIFDLRVFGFFSRFIDLSSGFLITEMLRSILEKKEFVTDAGDITRDYVHPSDLGELIRRCAEKGISGSAMDIYSKRPVSKCEIIEEFQKKLGLQVRYVQSRQGNSPTGFKQFYASKNDKAARLLGYTPKFSSMETLLGESQFILRAAETQ